MCLAVLCPVGIEGLSRRKAARAWQDNPHGAGFAYAHNGSLVLQKGFTRFPDFWKAYRSMRLEHGNTVPVIVHFRFATHGDRTALNCHPFLTCKDQSTALIHNGILPCAPALGSPRSDTRILAEDILGPCEPWELFDAGVKERIEDYIGFGNKLIVLHKDGAHNVFNEDEGHWIDGAWYSNRSAHDRRSAWIGQIVKGKLTYTGEKCWGFGCGDEGAGIEYDDDAPWWKDEFRMAQVDKELDAREQRMAIEAAAAEERFRGASESKT